jgi:hypothetical protein
MASSASVSWVRWAALVALLVGATFGVVAVHLRALGEKAIVESDRALAEGDTITAVERARDAAMSMAPGAPSEAGYARLESIAEAAETHGSFDVAAMAWRAVWTAVRSTRSEGRDRARLTRAGRGLVRVATRVCEGGQTRPPASCGASVEAALEADDLPSVASFTWLGLGAVAFLSGGAAAAHTKARGTRVSWLLVMGAGLLCLAVALLAR